MNLDSLCMCGRSRMNWHHSAVMRLAKCHATLMWRVTSLEDRADMTRISFMISLCTLSFLALGQPVVAAAEPSVRDVYALAESGRVQEAQQLMQQILRDHPNSGKAHFVNAELLAKEGRLAAARAELATAERLAPGLSFATRESVRNLQARLSLSGGGVRSESPTQSVPWGMLLFGALAIFGIIWIVRSMLRRAATPATMTSNAAPPVNGPMYGYGASPPPAAGGLGSGIMGGLVTGAAIG